MQNPFVVACERIGRRKAYKVSFPFHPQIVERIKELPPEDRKWNAGMQNWELSTKALYALIKRYRGSDKIYFDFGGRDSKNIFINQIKEVEREEHERKQMILDLEKKKQHWVKWKEELDKNPEKYSKIVHKNLKSGINLYPYQIAGTMFLNETRSALLSHEMGLGKTIQSIAYVEMNDFEKAFVITPNSLKFNYFNEVEKFTDSKAHIVNWKKNKYSIEESKYVIANYEFFNKKDKRSMDTKWKELGISEIDVLICDESHRVKNTKANTYKNFKRIFGKPNMFRDKKVSKIFLTGTPAPNRAYELYTVLNQISPLDFATKKQFYEYYLGMVYDQYEGWGYVESGEKHLEELYHKIAPYTHRKRKKEVLTDLPDKIYQRVILEMNSSEYSTYNSIEEGVANEFTINPVANPLTVMLRLRQYTSHIKTKSIKELIENVLDTGEKIVVVDVFKETLLELHKMFPNISGLHTGDQSVEERAEIVKEFQDPNSNMKIFIGSIQTCNYGLTLTAADKLFILTLPYSVGEYDQVADRCILKGELILTKNGYIPIEEVDVGDYVYTHNGNWKGVIAIKNKIERKKIFYDINYKGFYKPLRCTSDHRIYVYNSESKKYSWVEAQNIDILKHYLVFPKINVNEHNKNFMVIEYPSKHYNKKNINLKPNLNENLLYAFGRYVGDGHVNDHQVSICGHINEYDDVLFSINTINESFNIIGHTEYKRDNKIEMYISSIELRNNFKSWFGEGAKNKKIPNFIFRLKKNEIRSFLNGYYDADGYQRKNTQQASTVSKFLSYQLLQLEGLLNNKPTLRYNNHSKCWSFEYSLNNKVRRNTLILNDNGNVLYPIQEIRQYKPKRNDEIVYDLEVEDDNSFVVGLSTVHNCHRIGQKNVVNIYSLIFPDTIDDYVYSSIESKRTEIVKVMDNENYTSDVSESVLTDVINKIKVKHKRGKNG